MTRTFQEPDETKIVPLKELREEMVRYIDLAKKGASFLVVKRSRPVFKIVPPTEKDELWKEVIDFTKLKKGGVEIGELLKRL